jgi:Fe(3+) dicitrate transport protein
VALPVRVAYTFTATEFRSAFESEFEPWGSVRVGDELPYTPRHQVSAALEARQDQWAAALEGVYVSRMRTEAGQGLFLTGTSTDPHLVVNVTGQWRVREGASLVASIQNVTNRHDIVARHPAGVRPNLPRQAYLGLSVELGR